MPNIFLSLEFALSQPPKAILQAIYDQLGPGDNLPPLINWELLGDTAHNRGAMGFRDQQPNEGEGWTRLAIEIFDRLALTGEERRREHFRRNSMFARANLIAQLGPDENDSQRSVLGIERWLFSSLPGSPADLSTLSERADADDVRAMELIEGVKANLAVIRLLYDKVTFTQQAAIRELLEAEL